MFFNRCLILFCAFFACINLFAEDFIEESGQEEKIPFAEYQKIFDSEVVSSEETSNLENSSEKLIVENSSSISLENPLEEFSEEKEISQLDEKEISALQYREKAEASEITKKPTPDPFIADDTCPPEIMGPKFKGLLLVPKRSDLNPRGYRDIQGIEVRDMQIPGDREKLGRAVMPRFLGDPLDSNTVMEIKRTVIRYYRQEGRPIVTVIVPEQNITSGVVQMIVVEGKLGEVYARGNKWFKSSMLESAVRLQPGEPISSRTLITDIYWLNRNPFHRSDIVYTPGKVEGTTDIELLTTDRFPLRVYGGIDNTGNDVTGNNRLIAGFIWGNAFFQDQVLSYQFTTSDDYTRFHAHTVHWSIPLPWRNILVLYGGYSHVDAKFDTEETRDVEPHFRTHGHSWQASLRYDIPLKPNDAFLHEFTWGWDFKGTNNNLEFSNIPIIGSYVNLFQFMIGYNFGYETRLVITSVEAEGFWTPGHWLPDQEAKKYRSIRPFSSPHWFYFRGAFSLIWWFYERGWSWHNYLRAQVANKNLLPSEEYGVGGYNTVRGYKERIVNGDNAFIWNTEFRTPPFRVLARKFAKIQDEMQFLVFLDIGWESKVDAALLENKDEYLWSIGTGVRYSVTPYLTFRADWGIQLRDLNLGGPHQSLHFSLIGGY